MGCIRIVAHHYRAPGCLAGRLHVAFHAGGVGREPRVEHQVLVVQIEVHRGIVHAGSLVNIDVKAIATLHLQRRLHAGGREHRHRRVAPIHGIMEAGAYLREAAFLGFLLLSVVVSGQPPGGMVARHGELRVLILDDKVDERVLLGELIAQPHAVIVHAKADGHGALGRRLGQVHGQFVVVIADGGRLTPHRFPRLVEGCGAMGRLGEAVHQAGFAHALGGMAVLGQLEPQVRGLHHGPALVAHLVSGLASGREREPEPDVAVGRTHLLAQGCSRAQEGCYEQM